MRAKLSFSSNGHFTVHLFPETKAEREILRRVSECRELTVAELLQGPYSSIGESERIEIMPMPKPAGKHEPL